MNSLTAIDEPERGGCSVVQGERFHRFDVLAETAASAAGSERGPGLGDREETVEILVGHARDPADEIPQVVGEVRVVARLEPIPGKVAVLAVGDLSTKYTRSGSGPKRSAASSGSTTVPERFAHPLALEHDEAVPEDLAGKGEPGAHEHRRPIDAVEPGDVLADDMQIRRPPRLEQARRQLAKVEGRDVVDERIDPDVDDAVLVERDRDAPFLAFTTDRQIVQAGFEHVEDLVASQLGYQKLGVLTIVIEQRLSILGELEEVVTLFRATLVWFDGEGSSRRRDPSRV